MCVVAIHGLDDPLYHGPTPTMKALNLIPDFIYGNDLTKNNPFFENDPTAKDMPYNEYDASAHSRTTEFDGKPTKEHETCGEYCANVHVHENITKVATAMNFEGNGSKAEVIWDTGATLCVTPHLSDFATPPTPSPETHILKGLAKGLSINAVGTVQWTCTADDGAPYVILAPGYHVPASERRLLSPQAFLQKEYQQHGTEMNACQNWQGLYLNCPDGRRVSMPYNERNNLPTLYISTQQQTPDLDVELSLCVLDEANQNLTEGQKELLRWHYRFGHTNFTNTQRLLKSGALGHSPLQQAASRCAQPKCASCQYGKARRRPTTPPIRHEKPPSSIKSDDLFPGKKVSMDHFVVKEKGRLFESKGKTPTNSMYSGGCLFYDHHSGHIHVEFQVNLTATETIQAKQSYERQQFDKGVVVHAYHTDNGTFKAREYTKAIYDQKQSITFSGSGAHHQNGVAERAIGTIFSIARTMIIHAAIRWPEVIEANTWPMAISYAVWLYNHMPKYNGMSPLDLLCKTTIPRHILKEAHVFACPSYLLVPSMREGKRVPKFETRSRRGVFMGLSAKHASTVPLIMNLSTLTITPQFHVVFDDWFTSVNSTRPDEPISDLVWNDLFENSRYQYFFDDDDDVELDSEWLTENERAQREHQDRDTQIRQHQRKEAQPKFPEQEAVEKDSTIHEEPPDEAPPQSPREKIPPAEIPPTDQEESPTGELPSSPTPRRSGRQRQPPKRLGFGYTAETIHKQQVHATAMVSTLMDRLANAEPRNRAGTYRSLLSTYLREGHADYGDPIAYAAATGSADPDTFRYHEAMKETDWEEFGAAATQEIATLEKLGAWKEILRSKVPKDKRVLNGTWVFRRKRFPDGKLRKHKARYCVRGDQQVAGIDYFETYAPVTSWTTVRLLLTLSIVANLESVQVDYTNAFAQADLPKGEETFMEIPQGFYGSDPDKDMVLELKKSLYGLAQAPRVFYDHLAKNLTTRGFTTCLEIDPCLWIHEEKGLVCLVYVDDCLFFGKDRNKINEVIKDLEKDMPLTREDSVTAFLGIDIKTKDGVHNLTQPKLIERIIEATGLENANTVDTPATPAPLGTDLEGAPFKEDWHYASVVGMLMYLANNTRPDIAFAVHQCARFTHHPKASHAQAVKRIGRYLLGTKDKGLFLRPSKELCIDCYVDADFAGLYGYEDDQDPVSVKSRTGYVLTLANCPLLWASKLQTEITVSTMESEYVALSQSMRDVIPMRRMVTKVCDIVLGKGNYVGRMHSKIFEDNIGALQLARAPRITPRTKHFSIKYHFFREHVKQGQVKLFKIDTKNQLADIFTKGLTKVLFEELRKKLMGW
jgi:hypothetical protein